MDRNQQSHPVWDDDRVNEQSAFTSSPSSSSRMISPSSTNSLSLSPVQVDRPPSGFESDRSASPPPRGLHVRLSKSRTNTPKAPAPTPNIRTADNRRSYPLYSSSPVGSPKPTTPFIGAGYSLPTPASASYKSSIMAYFKRPAGIVAFGLILVLITACAFIGLSSQLVGLVQESHLSRLYKSQVECNPIVVVQTVAEDETKKIAISEPSPVPPPTIVTQYVTAPSVTPSGSCLIPSDSSLKQADGFWPRPLPNVVARDVPTPSEYAQSSASLVSLALAPRNQLDARYQATVDRLSGTDDFFHSHNNRPEDIAELQNPWPWARDNLQREDERRYIGEMWQHRLWQNGGGALPKNSPVPLFPWDTRFSRFRGVTPKRTQLSDAGRAAGRLKIKGQHPVIENENETAHSLCNRLLSYNPILFHELPCPILWQDDNGRMRWNQAAERGFYNLLKEQQFPSQQLLAPEHTTTNGEIDCTRMKYIVLYGIGKGHGLFSRWKSYFRAWRNAMAFDPSRIIVWEHRRNTVAHSIEEDMLEEGILRYFAPHSICSNHPYVLDVIRDCGDNERVIDDPDRHMPKMKLIHTHEDMLKPEVQAVQFLRFGIDTWEDPAHAPQRMQLFHYKQTPYVEPYPIDGKPATDQSPPSRTRMFSSWRERHVNLQTPTTFEHIYFAQEKTSRDSADNIRTRDLIYSEFAHRMLTAFAFNPSPDIHLMTKQLEHHWTSLMWDAEVEKVRNEIYEELTKTHPITKYDDTILPRLEAWRRVDRRLAEKIVRDSGSGWEDSDEASMPKEIEDGMRDEVMATTLPKRPDYSQFQPRPSSCMAPMQPTSGAADTTNATSATSTEFERRVDATMNHLRTFGPSAFQVRPHSFGSLYPIAGLVIRRGDKAVEDSFYIEHGQFRPLSMFVWKLHEEESRRTLSRRRYERSKGMTAEVPRFRFPAIFVMTDDLGVYEEILNCANSYPAVRADNATHYKALYEAALEEEKKFTAASLAASSERMQAIRNDAAARVARGETVDPYILKVGVPWNPDGGIAHLLPGAQCRSVTPPVCSPLSRFVLGGRTILHNVYAPPACFHPFKRVGFQQFLVTFQFFARNIQYWVGAMDSSMTQVLQILTESANQAHAHPQFGRITQGGTEKNPKWESWYPL